MQLRRETNLLLLGDSILLVFSLFLALTIRNLAIPSGSYFLEHFVAFIPIFVISVIVFFIGGLYEKQTRLVRSVMGGRIFTAQAANTVIAALLFFFLPFEIAPKTILAIYLIVSVIAISLWRFSAIPLLTLSNRQNAILVGNGAAVHEVWEEVNHNDRYLLRFVEYIDTSHVPAAELPKRIADAMGNGISDIVLDTRDMTVREILPGLYDAMITGVSFHEFSAFYESIFDRVPLEHIDHAWLLECLPKQKLAYEFGKRSFDTVVALIGAVVALIFILPAALVLKLSGGRAFIFNERVGRAGKKMYIVKLRSMLFDDKGDPVLREKNRVTTFGAFLRKTRIDELPQLWNVLTGDLSFIGPRPELPKIAQIYEDEIPYYGVRHLITPGLSGWAQIRDFDAPKGGADVERTKRKLSYDLYYLNRRSFVLDIVIALKTVRALLSFSGK
ncbi:MAG: putative colanic acid biosysnthesis UDP-glucose lipid carrier transferase [Parcubacteria bacterium C7867-007]|nr:MAG: putative colanic acid biosysnthesis UDP-glucose lipid carrier transferase [Parcubacteria bacterium C7867-007]